LSIGDSGTGTLNINNGGIVSDTYGFIGDGLGSNGTVTVNGVGSTWDNSLSLYVGTSGTGTLNIENGGAVSSVDGFIAGVSMGTVTITGSGSIWNTSGNLTINNNGTLNINNGGAVSVGGNLSIFDPHRLKTS
jgi:fibronectin-binding autotransporter adhesin